MPFTVPDGASYADRLDRPAGSLPGTDGCLAAALAPALRARGSERDVLAAIVDAAPYPIAARDAGGRFVVANAALEAFLGIGRDQLLGRTMEEARIPANIIAAVTPPIGLARASGQRVDETLRVQDAAGNWRDLLFATQPLRLPDGTLAGNISATIDITGQLAAEQAAVDAKRVLDEIAEALPVASFQLCEDPGGRHWFSYFSAKAERYRGWSAERLLAVVDGEYASVHPDDRLKMADALRQSAPRNRPPSSSCGFWSKAKPAGCGCSWARRYGPVPASCAGAATPEMLPTSIASSRRWRRRAPLPKTRHRPRRASWPR
ncbi:hypothetical protein AWV79_24755 [Cupriavidus sp. UYMMa02A]|nr:hypothetical protein AWV79_24755 [Cupriavidus sp. UYMMa02A]